MISINKIYDRETRAELTEQVPVDLTARGHERLLELKLRRSPELSYIVSMGLVVEELIDREFVLDHPEQSAVASDLLGSRD